MNEDSEIHEIEEYKIYSPMPNKYDTRPAELITFLPKNETELMAELELELMLFNVVDNHRLIENYTFSKMQEMIAITLMKRENLIVGFAGVQKLNLGHRILSRFYQSPVENRVNFSREVGRPTMMNIVKHQCLICDKLGLTNLFMSREPRGSMKHIKKFIDKINKETKLKWKLDSNLLETVDGSMQHIFWRTQ